MKNVSLLTVLQHRYEVYYLRAVVTYGINNNNHNTIMQWSL